MTRVQPSKFITFRCDICRGEIDTETNYWRDAIEELRNRGWTVNPFAKPAATHRCPLCRFGMNGAD